MTTPSIERNEATVVTHPDGFIVAEHAAKGAKG